MCVVLIELILISGNTEVIELYRLALQPSVMEHIDVHAIAHLDLAIQSPVDGQFLLRQFKCH